MAHYEHLGVYSDWATTRAAAMAAGPPLPSTEVRSKVKALLGAPRLPEQPDDVRVERRWERDGLVGEELSWWVGYGPRTRAWLTRPAGAGGPWPGVLALHDHGDFYFYGKEKVADGPQGPPPCLIPFRSEYYGGRAFADALAAEGFCVLVNDVFGWGSRRFPYEQMPSAVRELAALTPLSGASEEAPDEVTRYNAAACHHEHVVAKYATVLGTSWAAVVSAEDRAALHYLASRPEVTDGVGCIGLSGGGCRAALLTATSDTVSAAVIVGMMSTYEGLLDHSVVDHTWMFFPPGLAQFADWPDLAACHAPTPLLVQYNRDDYLFPLDGARAADQAMARRYAPSPGATGYTGSFYDGDHKFDLQMQEDAFAWLRLQLSS